MHIKLTHRSRFETGPELVGFEEEAWLEEHLDGWTTAIRVVSQDGHLVVAEVRIMPSDASPDRVAGTWDERRPIPRGGIRSGTMKGAKVPTMLTTARSLLADMEMSPTQSLVGGKFRSGDPFLLESHLPRGGIFDPEQASVRHPSHNHPGRGGNNPDHEDVLYFMVEYLDRVQGGQRKVVRAISEAFWPGGGQDPYVRGNIQRARKLGFLTKAPPGKAGGEITEKGQKALDDLGHPPRAPWELK